MRWKKPKQLTPTQYIILGYLAAILIASVILMLPISLEEGQELSYIDSLFTATSSVSVTGLTVVNVKDTFTTFGEIIMLILFLLGGIGIITLGTFLYLLLGRNISLSYRQLIMIDQNRNQLSGLVQLMRLVIFLSLIFVLISTVLFGLYFYIRGYFDNVLTALYYGLFHSISSYTNAGFDIFGNSLQDFSHDYIVQLLTMLLIIIGAIGFPVLIEVREYLFGKHSNFRFTLFTKLTTFTFFILLVIGTVGIFILENSLYYANMAWHEKLFYSLFNSVTARSGGLSTMDVSEYSSATQIFMSVLMFIGASPSSVGGGIRTTTFAIILLTFMTYAVGRTEVRVFRRSIKQSDMIKSFVIITGGIMLVITSLIVLQAVEPDKSINAIIFEIASAFGTCGLSMGITPDLSNIGKLIIMLLMFMGRIGIFSLLYLFRTKKKKETYHYPKEDIIIG
ncbi:TrkH family potassium uptake protein [Longirhabdus pacifica]|uniref:TrkH family potassium uptake protein n=1 Tax=Longirhabdus pacifica TaxID=2305227 RepID=UPI001008CE8B|nr:TrkH family potassium uptake protein [Longirhabdus pacifica]